MLNVMDEYILFTNKCFHKYLELILKDGYKKKICEEFINAYLNVRYSDYLDEASKKLPLPNKVTKAIELTSKELIKNYPEDKEVIELTALFISYFYSLDQLYILEAQKKTVDEISKDRTKLLGLKDNFVNEFNAMLRDDIKKRKDYLSSFESEVFSLDLKPYDTKDGNQIEAKLVNNIKFPDLYSEVAIKRAEEGEVISEDLVSITFLQVSALIISDAITCEFDKVYYVKLMDSLFDKKTKLNRVFNIIDNGFVQDRIRIIIDYKCFERYKSYVMELIRNGFVFVLNLDESFNYSSDNIEYLELFDKILINSSKYYYKDMKNNGKIKNRIISVNEV